MSKPTKDDALLQQMAERLGLTLLRESLAIYTEEVADCAASAPDAEPSEPPPDTIYLGRWRSGTICEWVPSLRRARPDDIEYVRAASVPDDVAQRIAQALWESGWLDTDTPKAIPIVANVISAALRSALRTDERRAAFDEAIAIAKDYYALSAAHWTERYGDVEISGALEAARDAQMIGNKK